MIDIMETKGSISKRLREAIMYKRKIIAILLCLVMCFSLSVQVLATDGSTDTVTIDQKAAALNKLSMLTGTSSGYNLEGYLTRGEGAAFIVQLLGKSKYISDNNDKLKNTGFSDVDSTKWYAPYIGFCKENSIIGGYPNGKFGPKDRLSEKSFLTMVLKAMGYTDFTGDEVYNKAYEAGYVSDSSYLQKTDANLEYKRGDVVELLYSVLNSNKKDAKVSVIKTLVNEGIIKMDTAIDAGFIKASEKLVITEIIPKSEMSVEVKFNKTLPVLTNDNVKINTFGNESEILEATIIKQQDNSLVLKTGRQLPQKNYYIKFVNIYDNDNILTPIVDSAFAGFIQKVVKSDFFKLSYIKPISKNMVYVYFTQPININAEDPTYYSLYENDKEVVKGSSGTILVKALATEKDAAALTFKSFNLDPNKEYTLKVSGDLNSMYGVNLCDGSGDSSSFIGIDDAAAEFALEKIYTLNNKTVRLDFNKQVNPTLAQQIYNYYITSESNYPIQIEKAIVSPDVYSNGKSVIISIVGAFDTTKNYSLMINNLNDIARQQSITERKYSFAGKYSEVGEFGVIGVTTVDTGTLDVYFNREIDSEAAAKPNNFTFLGISNTSYSSIPVKTYLDPNDPKKVRLYLGNDSLLTPRNDYKLIVQSTLKDYMGNTLGKLLYFNFNCTTDTKVVKPNISSATIISKDALKIVFTKEISLDVPNILTTNYVLEYTNGIDTLKKVPISVNYIDGTTMILKFDKLDTGNKYSIRFNSLKDWSGLNTSSGSEYNSVQVVSGRDK